MILLKNLVTYNFLYIFTLFSIFLYKDYYYDDDSNYYHQEENVYKNIDDNQCADESSYHDNDEDYDNYDEGYDEDYDNCGVIKIVIMIQVLEKIYLF